MGHKNTAQCEEFDRTANFPHTSGNLNLGFSQQQLDKATIYKFCQLFDYTGLPIGWGFRWEVKLPDGREYTDVLHVSNIKIEEVPFAEMVEMARKQIKETMYPLLSN